MIHLNKRRKFEFHDVIQVKNEYTYISDGLCAIRQKNTALIADGFYYQPNGGKMANQPFFNVERLFNFEYTELTPSCELLKFKLKNKPTMRVLKIHNDPDIYVDAFYTPTEAISKFEYNAAGGIVRINDNYLIKTLSGISPADLQKLNESQVWLFTHETLPPRVFSSKSKAFAYIRQNGGEINLVTMEK